MYNTFNVVLGSVDRNFENHLVPKQSNISRNFVKLPETFRNSRPVVDDGVDCEGDGVGAQDLLRVHLKNLGNKLKTQGNKLKYLGIKLNNLRKLKNQETSLKT